MTSATSPPELCLEGGGEAGAQMRAIDWSTTPLGPVACWPASLRTMIGVMLASRFGMRLVWGPEHIFLYNDGYRPILGATKHPSAMGSRTQDSFREVWDIVGPMFDRVFAGEAIALEDHLLPLDRNGYLEECYFTLSYSPVREGASVLGVLGVVAETTNRVLAERRLRTLRELASQVATTMTARNACAAAAATLVRNGADVPFAALYLTEPDGKSARLASAHGLAGAAKPTLVDLHATDTWPLGHAALRPWFVVDDLHQRFGELHAGLYPEPIRSAAILALTRPGVGHPYGFLIAGVNPRRALDNEYRDFFALAAEHVVAAIANALAFEEQRQRAESLAEIDRAKTTFFSSVSHEFRTPLTLILGPLENALAAPTPALTGADLVTAHHNAKRMLKLVSSLLEFSRIEAGRVAARFERTDIASMTRELATAFDPVISRGGLRLAIDCPPIDGEVFVDREMWERIVLNLISNAFKFTFDGEISVSLVRDAGAVELHVRDTGVGIAAHELPHLFERFHRVEGARSRSHEGSGIGLALVHEFVKQHGGELRVTSDVGIGTTFAVRLPIGSAHLPPDRIGTSRAPAPITGVEQYVNEASRWLPSENEPALSDPSASARILLVEDNIDMREYVVRLLAERWEVETATDGLVALQCARDTRPDLVISDVMMPGLDGFGLLRELRGDPTTRSIPVMLLSALAGDTAALEGLAHGADDFLVKPFSARELLGRVASRLENSRVQRAVEAHLEAERLRLHSFLSEAPAAIAILRGPSLVFELANPRYFQIIGKRDILGKPVRDALPELASQGVVDIFERIYLTGEPFVGNEFPSELDRSGDGALELGFFNWIGQPTHDLAGKIDGVMLFLIEVTDQVRARRQIEKSREAEEDLRRAAETANRAKDEFLAMLGHELRNPLAPILTALHLMRLRGNETTLDERVVIERQVDHLTRLVDDLLDVSRITSGKVELDRHIIELSDVVATAIEIASPLLEQRQHHLTVVVPRGLAIDGDATRLSQVISNLLTNAAKYTKDGGQIAVSAERERDSIVLRVRDNGIGIATDMLPSLFELFVQERQSLDRSQGGLGLGLAIVKSLVQMHGGSVAVSSAGKDCGSEFTITLPASALPAGSRAPAPPPAIARRAPTGTRILVVDDNEDAANLLAACLERWGYVAATANDGPSALKLAAELDPEVALLDIGLPVMDGYELARQLRAHPTRPHVHLIALTGYGQASDKMRARDAGFDAHVVKPVQLAQLEKLIESLVRS